MVKIEYENALLRQLCEVMLSIKHKPMVDLYSFYGNAVSHYLSKGYNLEEITVNVVYENWDDHGYIQYDMPGTTETFTKIKVEVIVETPHSNLHDHSMIYPEFSSMNTKEKNLGLEATHELIQKLVNIKKVHSKLTQNNNHPF